MQEYKGTAIVNGVLSEIYETRELVDGAMVFAGNEVVPIQRQRAPIQKEVRNIRKVTLNGQATKLFSVYYLQDGAWVFDGEYSAPARTANKRLLEHV